MLKRKPRGRLLVVRVSVEEFELYRDAAMAVERTVSNWVRERLGRLAEEELTGAVKEKED